MTNRRGPFSFDDSSISTYAPETIGIYYCGQLNTNNALIPHYIGRAKGDSTSIRSRLMDHLKGENWYDVSHFVYCVCQTAAEAETLEMIEIDQYKPKYNNQGK